MAEYVGQTVLTDGLMDITSKVKDYRRDLEEIEARLVSLTTIAERTESGTRKNGWVATGKRQQPR